MYGRSNTKSGVEIEKSLGDECRRFDVPQGPSYVGKTLDLMTFIRNNYKAMLGVAKVRGIVKKEGTKVEIHEIESNGDLFNLGESITNIIAVFSNSQDAMNKRKPLYVIGDGKIYREIQEEDAEKLLTYHTTCNGSCVGGREQLRKLMMSYIKDILSFPGAFTAIRHGC